MRLVLVVLLAGCQSAAPPRATFNDRVLSLVREYPAKSFGGYAWPAPPGTAGTTRDLAVGGDVIAKASTGNHCVGMTLEVFWRALDACPQRALDLAAAQDFKRRWYVPVLGGRGPADALAAHHLGTQVALEDARPGDFMQAWNRDETFGHSMVFLGWQRDAAGRITGVRYWSSQPWTEGIGESEHSIGDDGFDPSRIYIARAACPPSAL
jgi:hypothetical protein